MPWVKNNSLAGAKLTVNVQILKWKKLTVIVITNTNRDLLYLRAHFNAGKALKKASKWCVKHGYLKGDNLHVRNFYQNRV